MKHNSRRRRHLRPRPTRSQIHNSVQQYQTALQALRTEVAFELSRPSPSPERIHRMQERANFVLDLLARECQQ